MENTKKMNNEMMIKICKGILISAILCMLLCAFLPYATATEKSRKTIEKYENEKAISGLDYTCGDLYNVSMIEFVNINQVVTDDGIAYKIIFCCILGFAAIAGICAFFGKSIRTLVFTLLSYGMFWFQSADFESRKVVPSDNYKWSVAYYIYITAVVIIIAFAIVMKVYVVKKKKELRQLEIERINNVDTM